MESNKTVLCVVGALFGRPFLLEAKRLGWNVHLLTEERYLKEAWPRDQIDQVYAVPDLFDEKVVRNVVCYLSRVVKFDKIIGLGEFDIEVAAALREHTRIGGMGETTSRYFRDKLAMRMKADEDGINVPEIHTYIKSRRSEALHGYRPRTVGAQAENGRIISESYENVPCARSVE